MPTYQPNVPTGTVDLDQDFLNLQGNFQQLNIAYGYDHIPFSDTSGLFPSGKSGTHSSIHFNPISTTATNPATNYPPVVPATTIGFGQLFGVQVNDGFSADQTIYYLSGQGSLTQLTRNFQPSAASPGYTFLPGGLVVQWGVITATSGNPVVVFPKVFPTDVFSVQVTRQHSSTSPGSTFSYWVENTVNTTGFTVINNDGHTWSYNWIALGV